MVQVPVTGCWHAPQNTKRKHLHSSAAGSLLLREEPPQVRLRCLSTKSQHLFAQQQHLPLFSITSNRLPCNRLHSYEYFVPEDSHFHPKALYVTFPAQPLWLEQLQVSTVRAYCQEGKLFPAVCIMRTTNSTAVTQHGETGLLHFNRLLPNRLQTKQSKARYFQLLLKDNAIAQKLAPHSTPSACSSSAAVTCSRTALKGVDFSVLSTLHSYASAAWNEEQLIQY